MYSEAVPKENTRSDEDRTAETIVAVANSIDSNIQLTWDIPEKNNTKRMPVLDLEIWVEEMDGTEKVLHSFYKKKVASPYTILKRSALSYSVKKSTLLQEALRRLGAVSKHLP